MAGEESGEESGPRGVITGDSLLWMDAVRYPQRPLVVCSIPITRSMKLLALGKNRGSIDR